jgi:hypothetical protein
VRVAENLVAAGHNVTLIRMTYTEKKNPPIAIDPAIRQSIADGIPKVDRYEEMQQLHNKHIFHDMSFWDPEWREAMNAFTRLFGEGCDGECLLIVLPVPSLMPPDTVFQKRG